MEHQSRLDKKIAAAVAAVTAYLEQEQAALSGAPPAEPERPVAPMRLWAASGRQAQMADRRLMQMRAFR